MNENKPLTQQEIRAGLRTKFGVRFNSHVAEVAGRSGSWVSRHINGDLRTHHGRKILARLLRVKMEQIYPPGA